MTTVRPSNTPRVGAMPASAIDERPASSAGERRGVTPELTLPAAVVDTTNNPANRLPAGEKRAAGTDPARFTRLAGLLETATENQIGGVDVFLAVFTAFFSLPVSMRRLEGHIEHDEAQVLVDGAKTLAPEDRRALALALREMIDSGTVRLHKPFDKESGEGAKVILRRFIRETLADSDPTAADRAIGSLLAKVDTVQIALSDAHRDLTSAAQHQAPVNPSEIDLSIERVEALRVALERAPAPIREAARGLVRAQLAGYDWPANASDLPALAQLRAIIS